MAFDLTAARPEIATQVLTCPTSSLYLNDGVSPMCQYVYVCVCVRVCVCVLSSLTVPAVQRISYTGPRTALGRHVLTPMMLLRLQLARLRWPPALDVAVGGRAAHQGRGHLPENPLAVAGCAGNHHTTLTSFTPRPARRLTSVWFILLHSVSGVGGDSSFRTEPTNIRL